MSIGTLAEITRDLATATSHIKHELKFYDDIVKDASSRLEQLDRPGIPEVPWTRDIRSELPYNPGPYTSEALNRSGGWWKRTLDQITGVTIHHTLSDSPHATAAHYINKGGGRPTIPYTIWVTQTGEVLLCVALEQGLWHDHTGHENKSLSVGLAGHLHKYPPADVQLDAAVKVCVWAIRELPGVTSIEQIQGHRDRASTICPGWASSASGNWRDEFYKRFEERLK